MGTAIALQYVPRNMHTVFALLCFVVIIHWLIFPYPSGLLHWHCGNLTIAPVPAKQPWWIWINTLCEFIMNDCVTTTKQSTTKPCAYFLGYSLRPLMSLLLDLPSDLPMQCREIPYRYYVQYIPINMHRVFALLCFVVVIHWLTFPYPSGLLHWHRGNLTIAPVPAKQPWWIWINTSCEFILNDCITTTKQSTTKPCAYFWGYTVMLLVFCKTHACCPRPVDNFFLLTCQINGDVACFQSKECIRPVQTAFCPGY